MQHPRLAFVGLVLAVSLAGCQLPHHSHEQEHVTMARALAQLVVDSAEGDVIPPELLGLADAILADSSVGGDYPDEVLELAHAVRLVADGGAPIPPRLLTAARLVLLVLGPAPVDAPSDTELSPAPQ